MTSIPEVGKLPPSPEVAREMALTMINVFQTANTDYRHLATLIQRHPGNKRLATLDEASKAVADSSTSLIETNFFRDISPELVERAVSALVDEIEHNRELATTFDAGEYEAEFDDDFKQKLVERVLSTDLDEDDENGLMPLIVFDALEELSTEKLIVYMGDMHGSSVRDVFESLEESDVVQKKLEEEYLRRERVRTAVIGLVAFTGALGGTLIGQKLNKQK